MSRPPEPGLRLSTGRAVIRGIRPLREGSMEAADVLVADGRIEAVGRGLEARGAEEVDGGGLWLSPGWIDIQVNDMEWLAAGARTEEAHAARIEKVADHQARKGATGFILATLAAPPEEIIGYLRGMRKALDAGPTAIGPRACLGALVEGTFMNPELSGAHNRKWILEPTRELIDRFIDTGAVRLLNIAPETSLDAVDLIRHATSRGVIVGAGHAKPHAERLREAVEAGLRYVIHLGNGPTGSSLKAFRDGGMLEETLRNDKLIATIILDGVHIHPRLARDWMERKGADRVIAVSDAGFAMGNPAGDFEVLGMRGYVAEGGWLAVRGSASPNPLSSDFGALFGSAASMDDVFETAVNVLTREMDGVYHRHHAALPMDEALRMAARLTSTNPARLLGLEDRGRIEPGLRADLVFLEVTGAPGEMDVRVRSVWLGR